MVEHLQQGLGKQPRQSNQLGRRLDRLVQPLESMRNYALPPPSTIQHQWSWAQARSSLQNGPDSLNYGRCQVHRLLARLGHLLTTD